MASTRNPIAAKERADSIADLVSEASEKLVELASEWFALNDREGLLHAHRMMNAKEVTLMLSARVEESGLSHIALNLLRTETPMPRPFFEIQVPMQPWALDVPDLPLGESRFPAQGAGKSKGSRR